MRPSRLARPPRWSARSSVLATEAVENAHRRGGDHLGLRLFEHHNHIVVEARGAGAGPFVHLADRVGAQGGRLDTTEYLLRAELPCVW